MTYNPGGDIITRHDRDSQYVVQGFADTSTMHLDTGSVAANTAFMLIDISDTTNWKHTNTDHIIIDHLTIQADPDANFFGEIKIGFLKDVNTISGSFFQILDLDLRKKSDLIIEDLAFGGGFHCQASTHFGPVSGNATHFQTDVNIAGPSGAALSFPSGPGDLVMIVDSITGGSVDVSVTAIYETVGA